MVARVPRPLTAPRAPGRCRTERSTHVRALVAPELRDPVGDARIAARQAGLAAEKWGQVADTTNNVLEQNAKPAAENLEKAIASIQRAADNLDAVLADARPGVQNFSKSTLPEANRLIRDLRELSQSLRGVSERVEQGGIGGTLGPEKLPDYKPRKQ